LKACSKVISEKQKEQISGIKIKQLADYITACLISSTKKKLHWRRIFKVFQNDHIMPKRNFKKVPRAGISLTKKKHFRQTKIKQNQKKNKTVTKKRVAVWGSKSFPSIGFGASVLNEKTLDWKSTDNWEELGFAPENMKTLIRKKIKRPPKKGTLYWWKYLVMKKSNWDSQKIK
jgi:hypothetical protein